MFYINTLTVTNLTTLADLLARAPEPKDDNTNLRVPIWGRRFGGFLKNIKQDIQSPRTQKEPHKLKGPDLGKAFCVSQEQITYISALKGRLIGS